MVEVARRESGRIESVVDSETRLVACPGQACRTMWNVEPNLPQQLTGRRSQLFIRLQRLGPGRHFASCGWCPDGAGLFDLLRACFPSAAAAGKQPNPQSHW